jgi:hypothetical protein
LLGKEISALAVDGAAKDGILTEFKKCYPECTEEFSAPSAMEK